MNTTEKTLFVSMACLCCYYVTKPKPVQPLCGFVYKVTVNTLFNNKPREYSTYINLVDKDYGVLVLNSPDRNEVINIELEKVKQK